MLQPSQNRLLQFLSGLLKLALGCLKGRRRLALAPKPVSDDQPQNADAAQSKGPGPVLASNSSQRPQDSQEFESEIQRFLQWCHANVGALYVWPTAENRYSGKGLPGALYKGVYDCSGYVAAGIFYATKGKLDLRSHGSAAALWLKCATHGGHGPCLAFYGTPISHVVVVLPDGRVVGQSRGDSTCTTPAIALDRGARVMYHDSATYRRDLRGFRALPLKEFPDA